MKIVLQHTQTHYFFDDSGGWTPDVKVAVDFGSSQRAIDFAKAHNIKDVVVMAAFVKGAYLESVELPIDPAATASPRLPGRSRL